MPAFHPRERSRSSTCSRPPWSRPRARRCSAGSLRAIAEGAADFSALGADEREGLLREIERTHPEAFDALVRHTYAGYYSHPEIVTRLGLTPGPLHPRGHRIKDAELPNLTRVMSRGPLFRQA